MNWVQTRQVQKRWPPKHRCAFNRFKVKAEINTSGESSCKIMNRIQVDKLNKIFYQVTIHSKHDGENTPGKGSTIFCIRLIPSGRNVLRFNLWNQSMTLVPARADSSAEVEDMVQKIQPPAISRWVPPVIDSGRNTGIHNLYRWFQFWVKLVW